MPSALLTPADRHDNGIRRDSAELNDKWCRVELETDALAQAAAIATPGTSD
jgi:hypothetical protein